jgi:hypothetical protein
MFWGKQLMSLFSEWILQFDAALVSWATGLDRAGNTIALDGGFGVLWIAIPCSSFSNVSLAMVCWVAFARSSDRPVTYSDLRWCLLACLAVIAVNVSRLSLLALAPDFYDAIHGPTGAAIAGWTTLFAVVGICAFGMRRDLLWRS